METLPKTPLNRLYIERFYGEFHRYVHHIFNKLKKIQRRADDDYGTRTEKLNLLSLQDRRFFFLMFLFFYKVFLMGTLV